MEPPFSISDLADVLSLTATAVDDGLRLSRQGYAVTVPADVVGAMDAATPLGRHLAYGVLFGVRLAIDRRACDFDVAHERKKKPAKVFIHTQIPSPYGERLPRLVTTLTLAWYAALSGEEAVTTDWIIDGLRFVYILETGKYLHVLSESDLANMELSRERLVSDARHALFYDSYKLKPRETEPVDGGAVRVFRTSEGLTAGRALLLPDFDYDAAQENGCFAVPSRDTMIIGRPDAKSAADAVCARVAAFAAQMLETEAFPLSSMICRMTSHDVAAGEHTGSVVLPPGDELASRVRPPAGIALACSADQSSQ